MTRERTKMFRLSAGGEVHTRARAHTQRIGSSRDQLRLLLHEKQGKKVKAASHAHARAPAMYFDNLLRLLSDGMKKKIIDGLR